VRTSERNRAVGIDVQPGWHCLIVEPDLFLPLGVVKDVNPDRVASPFLRPRTSGERSESSRIQGSIFVSVMSGDEGSSGFSNSARR
jgi:hypothetical protein